MLRTKLILLFFMTVFRSEASETTGQCHGTFDQPITSLTTTDLLHHLFVDFKQADNRENDLKFRAETIDLKNGTIVFTNPRLNGKAISFYRSECVEKKKNFLGYEICQKIGQTPIANKLCEQLGLKPHETVEGEVEVVRSSKEPFTFQHNEGEWHSLRLYSALAPPIKYPRLKALSCKYL